MKSIILIATAIALSACVSAPKQPVSEVIAKVDGCKVYKIDLPREKHPVFMARCTVNKR